MPAETSRYNAGKITLFCVWNIKFCYILYYTGYGKMERMICTLMNFVFLWQYIFVLSIIVQKIRK